jgi:hypothetical protein
MHVIKKQKTVLAAGFFLAGAEIQQHVLCSVIAAAADQL